MYSHQMIIAAAEQHRSRLLADAERHRRIRGPRDPRWEDFATIVRRRPHLRHRRLPEIAVRAWQTLRNAPGDLTTAPTGALPTGRASR